MYTLTGDGRAYASWDAVAGMTGDAGLELGNMIRQIMMTVMEVRRAGSAAQLWPRRAAVLAETRRSLYRILADDIGDEGTERWPDAWQGGEADGE